jgi:cell wall-associated NlpC family hydrolase
MSATVPRLAILLFALTAGGCASSGAIPKPFPTPGGGSPAPSPSISPAAPPEEGYAIAGTALSLRGVPYRNGGSTPDGFDCSGFVWYVFDRHGVKVPRTVSEQYRAGSGVGAGSLRAGDLLFFDTSGGGANPTHVGIAIGGDEFVHAPSTAGQVRVEHLAATYWAGRFVGARRLE